MFTYTQIHDVNLLHKRNVGNTAPVTTSYTGICMYTYILLKRQDFKLTQHNTLRVQQVCNGGDFRPKRIELGKFIKQWIDYILVWHLPHWRSRTWLEFVQQVEKTCESRTWSTFNESKQLASGMHANLTRTANLKIIDVRYQLATVFSTSLLPENSWNLDNGRQLFWDWQYVMHKPQANCMIVSWFLLKSWKWGRSDLCQYSCVCVCVCVCVRTHVHAHTHTSHIPIHKNSN